MKAGEKGFLLTPYPMGLMDWRLLGGNKRIVYVAGIVIAASMGANRNAHYWS